MVSPRTICSASRTGVYGTLAAVFSINDPHTLQVLEAVLIGAILGDFFTWAMRSLIKLPTELWHGVYDGAINLVCGALIYQYTPVEFVLRDYNFLYAIGAFVLVAIAKLLFYLAVFFREENEDCL
jgi:hypothetical protein